MITCENSQFGADCFFFFFIGQIPWHNRAVWANLQRRDHQKNNHPFWKAKRTARYLSSRAQTVIPHGVLLNGFDWIHTTFFPLQLAYRFAFILWWIYLFLSYFQFNYVYLTIIKWCKCMREHLAAILFQLIGLDWIDWFDWIGLDWIELNWIE